ncbi:MAG: hypothetical protein OSB67_02365 [Alphaproteobacteria bacterium]|nr:hypothetical protein [Alphaproteobacteria bacterium]
MNDQPDFAALARQYLDLWEGQLTAMSSAPGLAEQSACFFDAMNQLGKDANPILTANLAEFLKRTQMGTQNEPDSTTSAEDRAPASPSASDDRDEWMDQLSGRLAALEERFDQLESGSGKKGGGTASRPRAKPSNTRPKKS